MVWSLFHFCLFYFYFFYFFAAQNSQLKRYWSGWREYDKMKKRERNQAAKAEQFAARLIKRWAVAYSTVTIKMNSHNMHVLANGQAPSRVKQH